MCVLFLICTIGNSIYANASQGNKNYYANADEMIKAGSAPTSDENDKIFSGWYTTSDYSTCIKSADEAAEGAYAKFVDKDVLSVKFQILTGTDQNSQDTDLRMVTTVDSRKYSSVGFDVTINGKTAKCEHNTVHSQITGYTNGKGTVYKPTFFSAESSYFMAFTLENIKNAYFDLELQITPTWITMDGTQVMGEARTFTISEIIEESLLDQATIENSALMGTWTNSNIVGLNRGYDDDETTMWNPCASVGYVSGEGVIYTLDERYDIEILELTFDKRYFYFDILTSSDGSNYTKVITIDADNYTDYYTNAFVCTIDNLTMKDVKYIKVIFGGDSEDKCWINLLEVRAYGRLLQAHIQEAKVTGEWLNDRTATTDLWSLQKTYDGDISTYWNPCASDGYASEEGALFVLDDVYDLTKLKFTFNRYYYFEVLVSSDGNEYTSLAKVNSRNQEKYYVDGCICVLDELDIKNVKYIQLRFTGDSANSCWVSFYEVEMYGRESSIMFNSVTPVGEWVNDRTSLADASWSPQKAVDNDITTYWNPCASSEYASGEGVIYSLNRSYDITELQFSFGKRYSYFIVSVSSDGNYYNEIATVDETNQDDVYVKGYYCVLKELKAENVRYIKLNFIGSSDDVCWINLYEFNVFGNVVEQVGIEGANVLGTWRNDRLSDSDALWSPQKSYDDDVTTRWNPWASVGYSSQEAIVYTLAHSCDLERIQFLFGDRYYYFHIAASVDGESYTRIATVDENSRAAFYTDGYLCKIGNLDVENVKYIMLEFIGDSSNSGWINLYDVKVQSKKTASEHTRNTTSLNAGVDDLGRTLDAVVEGDQSKEVGLFYFLLHGSHGTDKIHDVTKILRNDANAMLSDEAWLAAGGGTYYATHWWSEPLFGYFTQSDTWVIDRDVQMLTDAGVDFLVIDCSNAYTYTEKWLLLLSVLDKYYEQGFDVPQVTAITRSSSGATVTTLYEEIYSKYPEYSHLWYRMNGKPLIIGDNTDAELAAECLEYYTFLYPQWPREEYHADGMPWMDFGLWTENGNSAVFGTEGSKTIMNVSLAQHSGTLAFSSSALYGDTTNHTRSWHNGANDTAEDAYLYGYNFAEQFEYAIESNPDIIFITGWNEWIAQRQQTWNGINGTITDPVIFVDNADINNSRDIQPMKGGYGDNYYMQMMQYIRQYKGTGTVNEGLNTTTRILPITIDVSNSFSQWKAAKWYYLDYLNDTNDRNAVGYGSTLYTDTTGRNDIHKTKVANDGENLYAYVETKDDIVGMGEEHCLSMFIRTGNSANETWCGYDFVVNRVATSNNKLVVEKRTATGWQKIAEVSYRVEGNELQFAIPLATLGLNSKHVSIEFKFADNYQGEDDIFSFYLNGDAAPYGRANYVYDNQGVFCIKKFNINPTKAVPNGIVE